MAGFGYSCAAMLALVFVRAGVAKVARPSATVGGFVALGVPAAAVVARTVPVAELALAVALLAVPTIGALAALVLLGAFSAFLARAVRSGSTAPCNCFGQARAEPVSGIDLVRNGLLALLAAAALFSSRPVDPGPVGLGAALALGAAGWAVLAGAARVARRGG